MEMATLDMEQAQQQLDRYAEDFGKLYKEYLEIRSQLDLALKDARSELFTKLYAHADHAIMVTDIAGNILSVNPAFTSITGYAEEEVCGRTPRILSSGKQDKAFYAEMWRNLVEKGEWQGEIWNRRKNGEVYAEWLHIVKASDGLSGSERYVAMFYDISIHRNSRNHIYELANHDPLTGLPNRALCRDRLQQAIAQARRNGSGVGVLFIDLDRFKEVNDTLGHAVGDKLLIDFSWRVVHAIRDSDTAARLGGDEFVVVAPGVTSESDMRVIAEKIIRSLTEPFLIEDRELYVGASVGIALYPTHGDNVDDLLRQSDTAMYAAKTGGGNACRLFDDELNRDRAQRLDMETALRHALAQQQFQLAYQPQVRAADGKIVGVEALLRWHWTGHGNVPPDRFIPVAEATGLIVPIGEWVLRSACAQLAAWRSAGLLPLRMAVNIAARQLSDPDFADRVAGILAEEGVPPDMFEIEITESQLMENLHIGLDNLVKLRTLGVTVAIDDFGTGHSSLGRIRSLPIDRIKVDKSFVVDVDRNPNSYAIAHAVLAMANALKLETIAEGVEHQDQAKLLNAIKCTEFQGYLYGRPQPPEAIAALLAQQKGEMQ
jgi:diguanylate cyclase (GGDEF)-like protein/PAS domain S-box-containing protein